MVCFKGSGGECQEWRSRQPGRAGASPPGPNVPTGCAGAATRYSNETCRGLCPGFFLPAFRRSEFIREKSFKNIFANEFAPTLVETDVDGQVWIPFNLFPCIR